MELLYGTSNEGKLLVMRRALSPLGITVTGLKERQRELLPAAETGSTLSESARLKAEAYFEAFQALSIAIASSNQWRTPFKTMTKQVPPPAASSTHIFPLCRFTISWAMQSPSPKCSLSLWDLSHL